MSIFVRIPPFFNVSLWVAMETMKFQINKQHLFLRTIFFLNLGGPIEQIYTHKDMSCVFN